MPNAARLVAALCLAVLAFVVSGQVKELFPEGTYFGNFTLVNVALGVIVGWLVMGRRTRTIPGIAPAINNGITGVAVLVFWGLFVQGIGAMVKLAMRNRYGGPFEAITDTFRIMSEYGLMILVPNIIATLAIGAVLAGFATQYAARMWR
ncbi:MAG: TrgA family protein [Rhodobacteraceae bacterium]|nr:TrgA family protein [Paracoccaceae bacterium]